MSLMIFPTVRAPGWNAPRRPTFNTMRVESASLKSTTVSFTSQPRWEWDLIFEYIKDNPSDIYQGLVDTDMRSLFGFFNARFGSFDNFLFQDPFDNKVTAGAIGVGDGSTTAFQLKRQMGAFLENIQAVDLRSQALWIYQNGTFENLALHTHGDMGSSPWAIGGGSQTVTGTSNNQTDHLGTTNSAATLVFPTISGGQFANWLQTNIDPKTPGMLLANRTFTFSCWMRAAAGTVNNIALLIEDTLFAQNQQSVPSLTTTWQRYSVTITFGAGITASTLFVGFTQTANTSGVTIYVEGAQVEEQPQASALTYTGASQFNPTYSFTQQNLILQSQTLATAPWSATSCTATNGAVADPNGVASNATRLAYAGTVAGSVTQTVGSLGSLLTRTFTLSFWARCESGTVSTVQMFIEDGLAQQEVLITPTLTTGWIRYAITITFTNANAGSGIVCGFFLPSGNAATTIDVWGCQLEESAVASSYAATTTATVLPSNGVFSVSPAPAANVALTATFMFFFYAQFKDDTMSPEQFMRYLWSMKKLTIVQDKQ